MRFFVFCSLCYIKPAGDIKAFTSERNIMCCYKNWITIGALSASFAVVTGAFAAHGLDGHLTDLHPPSKMKTIAGFEVPASYKYLQDFKTAADYQMVHSLGLIMVGLLALHVRKRSLTIAAWSFVIGIVLFSGSLYLLVLLNQPKLGMITPLGGVAFLVGWIALAVAGISCMSHQPTTCAVEPAEPDKA